MHNLALASASILLITTAPLVAQEQLFRSVDAVLLVGNVSLDCKVGPKPDVKVVSAPKQGTLAIRSGKTKAGSLARCPSLEVPAEGVFYQARPNFASVILPLCGGPS